MSLNRLLLRAATVAVFTKAPGETDHPTIAEDKVFDSRLDPIEFTGKRVEIPIITVYTDVDEATPLDAGLGANGSTARQVELVIEFAVASFEKGQNGVAVGMIQTDAELEALLDLFEHQIMGLLYNPARPASVRWMTMVRAILKLESKGERSSEGNNRLAARQLRVTCKIAHDCLQRFGIDEPGAPTPPRPNAVPTFEAAPYLTALLNELDSTPTYRPLVDTLRAIAGGPANVRFPRLSRFGVKADSVDHVDPQLLAQAGKTTGPDGRPELEAVWPNT